MNGLEFELGEKLVSKNLTIATAESCTGGLLANRITNVPGSSRYFERGVIVYSNQSKNELLNVPTEVIESYGAVSLETAKALAIGIKEVASTDLGLGVTGVAGPAGGTSEKPVGLVYIGLAARENIEVRKFNFNGDRLEIKNQTCEEALKLMIKYLDSV